MIAVVQCSYIPSFPRKFLCVLFLINLFTNEKFLFLIISNNLVIIYIVNNFNNKIIFFLNSKLVYYSYSSFTNRCTFIKTLITLYIKIRWLLHVSVYDHHQGACN